MPDTIDLDATYVATERLYVDNVLAHDVGHEVPAENIKRNGWSDKVAKVGTKAADTVAPDGPPPKSGAGSGVDAWAAYAAARGVETEPDAKRDDIIAALDAAGVPTE